MERLKHVIKNDVWTDIDISPTELAPFDELRHIMKTSENAYTINGRVYYLMLAFEQTFDDIPNAATAFTYIIPLDEGEDAFKEHLKRFHQMREKRAQ